MTRNRDSLIWGIILLAAGVIFLLWNFGVFAQYEGVTLLAVVGFFVLVGLSFLVSYLMTRQDWWKVIPGFALLAVAGILFLSSRQVPGEWIGALLFIGLALAFAVIYISDRQANWWALIPFGAMVVMVAIVLLASSGMSEKALGAILFGGMGLVFLLVYLLAADRNQFRWSLIPTSVLLVMGLVTLAGALVDANPNWEQAVRLWPILLVVVGVFFIGLSISRPKATVSAPVELAPEPQPEEFAIAPGTSVTELDDIDQSREPAVTQAPVTWAEIPAAAAANPPEAGDGPGDEHDQEAGGVPDLYEFLQSAPPDPHSEP